MVEIDRYVDDLSYIEEIKFRQHIGQAYLLSEKLDWCDPSDNLDLHKRTMSEKDDFGSKRAIVPVISAKFSDHGKAQSAYAELQSEINNMNIDVHDIHYNKEDLSIGVILDPFDI